MTRWRRPANGFIFPALLLAALTAISWLDPAGLAGRLHEAAFDRMATAFPRESSDDGVLIVDIDRVSLSQIGPWPWPRDVQARLLSAVIKAQPASVAVDIAYLEPDRTSPAALARRLAETSNRKDIAELARLLTDGDRLLADAIGDGAVALGLLLEPSGGGNDPPPLSLSVESGAPDISPWQMQGMVGPADPLFSAATGFGVLSLPVEPNGLVRFAPMLAASATNVFAGLSLESLRLAESVSVPVFDARTSILSVGQYRIPLNRRAEVRLYEAQGAHWAARTISAASLLGAKPAPEVAGRLKGRIVFIGGSAPELGALRATAQEPATPSVRIHANLAEQMRAGTYPRRLGNAGLLEALASLLIGFAAIIATQKRGPLIGLAALLGLASLWFGAAVTGFLRGPWLIDPVMPPTIGAIAFVATAIGGFVASRASERHLRTRFAQRLAPGVVDRIIADPSSLKLDGSRREITVLFTDIESFTALTERTDPEKLIGALDRYMELVSGLIVTHGGMVDKIVGDSVHAIFNAPIDLADHARRAIECAIDIHNAALALQNTQAMQEIGLGRTRIGIETGMAVVGDVGGKARLDYTAHGDVINMAARLEAANKELGTSILVGPAARAAAPDIPMRDLGTIELRGLSRHVSVSEPLIQA